MMHIDQLKEILYEVKGRFGRGAAAAIIRDIGGVEILAEIPEHKFNAVFFHAKELMNATTHQTADALMRAAHRLESNYRALENLKGEIVAAIDDLKSSVNQAVTEMGRAADFIRNHPAAKNDSELQDMASRLKAASEALGGVDVESVQDAGSGGATAGATGAAG